MNEHPAHGIRLRFDLRSATDEGAVYHVTVYDGAEAHRVEASLASSTGQVRFESVVPSAPGWVAASVLPFAKQILSARRSATVGVWPRRVLRWRAARP